jgi:hypothetical protein
MPLSKAEPSALKFENPLLVYALSPNESEVELFIVIAVSRTIWFVPAPVSSYFMTNLNSKIACLIC